MDTEVLPAELERAVTKFDANEARIADRMSYGDIQHETRLTLTSIQRLLEAAGAGLADVVKVQVFLKDGADFQAMNEVYREFFDGQPPTRTTVAVSFVDPVMKIEIDCIAYRPLQED